MHTVTAHPVVSVGLALVVAGSVLYLFVLVLAVLRVNRQYSSAMRARRGIRAAAVFGAAGKFWPLPLMIVAGVVLLVLVR